MPAPASIDTAVIAAAGAATRMWPTSKAVPKELLPLGSAPAILHLLDELHAAGIRRVIIVIGDRSEPLLRLLDPTVPIPEKVRAFPWVQRLGAILESIDFVYIRQSGPYGNGTPLLNAASLLGGRPCIYCFSDDIVFGENITRKLIRNHEQTGSPAAAVQPVEPERVSFFGIMECKEGSTLVQRVLEKPQLSETSSRLAIFGRYLATPGLIEELSTVQVGKGGELWFTDAMIQHMQAGNDLHAIPLETGHWYTVGDPEGYAAGFVAAVEQERR